MATKQVSVTFEFDTDTELVSNVHAFVDGIEKKKKTTKKAPKEEILEDEAIITREDNKLVLNNKAAKDLDVQPEDRLIIKYEKRLPVIGTDISWDEEGAGNKLTKSNTVTYRGKANTVLAEYGTVFKLEPHKDGLFKLVSTEPVVIKNYPQAVEQAENLDVELMTEDDNTTEIDELTFKL